MNNFIILFQVISIIFDTSIIWSLQSVIFKPYFTNPNQSSRHRARAGRPGLPDSVVEITFLLNIQTHLYYSYTTLLKSNV